MQTPDVPPGREGLGDRVEVGEGISRHGIDVAVGLAVLG